MSDTLSGGQLGLDGGPVAVSEMGLRQFDSNARRMEIDLGARPHLPRQQAELQCSRLVGRQQVGARLGDKRANSRLRPALLFSEELSKIELRTLHQSSARRNLRSMGE